MNFSVLGRAFVHVADELQIPAHKTFENNGNFIHLYDTHTKNFANNNLVVFIRAEDRTKFFNGLEARLEVV